jgi:hypothetical protein
MYKLKTDSWFLERVVFLMAGIFILGSVILGFTVSQNFFYFTGLVGFMQLFFSVTGLCPMAILLDKAGIKGKLNK